MIGSPPSYTKAESLAAVQRIFAASGENRQGALYLADESAMLSATDGSTLTPTNGTVGVLLDQSKAPVKVVESDFTSALTGWALAGSSTLALSNGQALLTITGTGGGIQASPTFLAANKTYLVSADITLGTYAGSMVVVVGGQNKVVFTPTTIKTKYYFYFSTATDASFAITRGINASGTVLFDNIVGYEILGYHATQATLASRPSEYITAQTAKRLMLGTATQSLSATFPNFSSCTVFRIRERDVEFIEGVSINGTVPITESMLPLYGVGVITGTLTEYLRFIIRKLAGFYQPQLSANLVPNPSFDNGIDYWAAHTNASIAWSTELQALELNVLGATGGVKNASVPVTAGLPYLISVDVRLGTFNGTTLSIDLGTIGIAGSDMASFSGLSSTLQTKKVGVIASAGANACFRRKANNTGTIYLYDVKVQEIL